MKSTICLVALFVLCLDLSNAYALDPSTLHGTIVFSSSETDSVGDIFIMNPDGSGKQNISNDPGMHSMEPFISYDGTQITWYGGVAHQAQIYVSDINGDNIHTITSDGYNNVSPAFSPDDQEIAFIRYFANCSLYVMPSTGGSAQHLATGGLGFPHWSPSGDKITYTDWDSGWTADIYVINADGTNNTLIAASPGYKNLRSMWSPDGSKIAYMSDKDGTGDVWIMDPDGNNEYNLFTGTDWLSYHEDALSWSPDGQYMVVQSDRSGNWDLWIFEVANPANAAQITDTPWNEGEPHWQIAKLAAIEADVVIDPDTLNLKSQGKWITCYIELPEGYNVADIDVSTVKLNDIVPAEAEPTSIGDYDSDGIADLMVKFNMSSVQSILEPGDSVEITVTGELNDGTTFEGSDTIRVINPGK